MQYDFEQLSCTPPDPYVTINTKMYEQQNLLQRVTLFKPVFLQLLSNIYISISFVYDKSKAY